MTDASRAYARKGYGERVSGKRREATLQFMEIRHPMDIRDIQVWETVMQNPQPETMI